MEGICKEKGDKSGDIKRENTAGGVEMRKEILFLV